MNQYSSTVLVEEIAYTGTIEEDHIIETNEEIAHIETIEDDLIIETQKPNGNGILKTIDLTTCADDSMILTDHMANDDV